MGSGPRWDSRSSLRCPRLNDCVARPCHPAGATARGFTLIELVVSITVGAIISGTAGLLILNATRQHAEISARSELIDMGSAGLEVMLRYIREIQQNKDPNDPTLLLGNALITTAKSDDLQFDNHGFHLSGTNVEITNDKAAKWHPLMTDVSGLTFTYYGWTPNQDQPTILDPQSNPSDVDKIRRISIQIDMTRGSEGASLRTSLYLRNFMNEVINAP